ncbi:uncharacterized [Lates japonicus]
MEDQAVGGHQDIIAAEISPLHYRVMENENHKTLIRNLDQEAILLSCCHNTKLQRGHIYCELLSFKDDARPEN